MVNASHVDGFVRESMLLSLETVPSLDTDGLAARDRCRPKQWMGLTIH
jgi:hypothetical protein